MSETLNFAPAQEEPKWERVYEQPQTETLNEENGEEFPYRIEDEHWAREAAKYHNEVLKYDQQVKAILDYLEAHPDVNEEDAVISQEDSSVGISSEGASGISLELVERRRRLLVMQRMFAEAMYYNAIDLPDDFIPPKSN